ncbi:MAG: hypothetical protein H7096_08675 [Flavobacterium sp.]|nr:hypothetical protein [Pedobacter sp.]
MIRFITFSLTFFLSIFSLSAQTTRTDVTIIGSSTAGISAGIQAARSGVKAIIIDESKPINAVFTASDLISLERLRDHYIYKQQEGSSKKDSIKRISIPPERANAVLKSISDTVKNLTMMLNTRIKSIGKEKKGWEIKLADGRTIKTSVLVYAANETRIFGILKLDQQKTILQLNNWLSNPASLPKVYRTSFGWGSIQNQSDLSDFVLPAAMLIPIAIENLFIISADILQNHIGMMLAGQAAGASAAYCAFFKTTSQKLNIRITQGELLAFNATLIPYRDVDFKDRHGVVFQHIGLTGILKPKVVSGSFVFDSLGTVSSEELRLPMKEYYSRSQIWFADHKKDSLTVEDGINLLMFTATRGEELRREIEAGWQSSFKFTGIYNPKKILSRREFAVLTDTYLQPFNIKVDFSGKLMN